MTETEHYSEDYRISFYEKVHDILELEEKGLYIELCKIIDFETKNKIKEIIPFLEDCVKNTNSVRKKLKEKIKELTQNNQKKEGCGKIIYKGQSEKGDLKCGEYLFDNQLLCSECSPLTKEGGK